MNILAVTLALIASAFPLAAQDAPRVALTLSGTDRAELEAVRKAVWVDWFSGDTAALRSVLGPELVSPRTGPRVLQAKLMGRRLPRLRSADQATPLDVDDLDRLATAAYLTGRS